MKWLLALFLAVPSFAEFNPVPTGDVKTDNNLKSVVEEMKRLEQSVTTTTWTNSSIIISTTAGSPSQGICFQDGTCQYTAAVVGASSIGTPWQGVNYHLWSSSGPVVIFSTGTRVFSIAASSLVYRGALYTTTQQNFTLINSTYSAVTWNPTNGFRQWGLTDFTPPGISSPTKANWTDDIIIGFSSANANGVVSVFETAQKSPDIGIAIANSGTTNTTPVAGGVHRVFDCGASRWFNSCISNSVGFIPQNPQLITLYPPAGTTNVAIAWGFVVNNTTAGSLNLSAFASATANQYWISVNGATATSLAASTVTSIAVAAGYSLVMIYHGQQSAGTVDGLDLSIPASVNIVRAGFW